MTTPWAAEDLTPEEQSWFDLKEVDGVIGIPKKKRGKVTVSEDMLSEDVELDYGS